MALRGDTPNMTTRDALRTARGAKRLTQAQIAAQAGIGRQHYIHIERGERTPSLKVALALARILGVRVENLFGSADNPA